jgi:two-component system aerobic respiration control sensor histidine kinase ArcB
MQSRIVKNEMEALIQQLKKQILELKEENQHLKKIIESTPGNLYWKSRDHVYLGCNRGIADSIGLKNCEDIIGDTIYDFLEKDISFEAAKAVQAIDDEIMQTGKLYEIEEIGFGDKTFITKKHPIYNSHNEVIGLLGISLDISDRKKMEHDLIQTKEQAEAASRAKSLFLGNMSHDIRTPLNGILGLLQVLELTESNLARKQDLNLIQISARRLMNLLSEIIDVAYIENGMPIKLEYIDLRAIIMEIQELLLADVIQKNLQMFIVIDEAVPKSILTDRMRVHRILLNLIANALKFTNEGYIKIGCKRCSEIFEQQSYIEITVEDSGIGIAEADQQQIFENFTRLTPSDQSPYKGHGLGLYIVQSFLRELGGNITVTSQLEQGSTFTCKLPMALPPLPLEKADFNSED